jgi:long-chain acyl-CoA synthetase
MLTWLRQRFAEAQNRTALIWRDESVTYGWLLKEMDRAAADICAAGIGPGAVVSLESDYSPQACAYLLALVEARTIVVPMTSAAESNRDYFLEVAEVEYRLVLGDQLEPRFVRTKSEACHSLFRVLRERNHPGLVLFSTGSTGMPKAALHDFVGLLRKFEVLRKSLRAIAFLLLDHIGGLNTLLYVLSNCGTLVTLESRDPEVVCQTIERHLVELLPTSPTFLNLLLLSEAHLRYDLTSLKLITYGTEPMPESTLKRIHDALPHARLQQTYGLSELGILRSKSQADDSLWVKVGGEGFETEVRDGILWIRAESAMLGYLNAPSPFDEHGWFNTQDEVLVDGDYMQILGRRSEVINVGGLKVYPAEVESVLLELDGVLDASVRGESNLLTGQAVVATLTLAAPEDAKELRRRVRAHCADRLERFKIPVRVEQAGDFQHSARFKKDRRFHGGQAV